MTSHPQLPLKELDAALLTLELLEGIERMPRPEQERIVDAAHAAALLHRGQIRLHRGEFPTVPYIEHPLRNTVRLIRWGVDDPDVLCATLLHDVPEDCADRVVQMYGPDATGEPVAAALDWIARTFGARTAQIVAAVTVPPTPRGTPEAVELAEYAAHVRRAVEADPQVLLVKASDLTDNAGSLTHQVGLAPQRSVDRLLRKYTPVVDDIRAALDHGDLDPKVAEQVRTSLEALQQSLRELSSHLAGP